MNVGETYEIYNERTCSIYTKEWLTFDQENLDIICNHIKTQDIPENGVFILELLKKSGFSIINKPFRDKNKLFAVYVIER